MCGINGIVGAGKDVNAAVLVRKMNDSLSHRGPDAEGLFEDEGLVLGHRRLAIIDTNERGNQPFQSADGRFVIAFNGEIYNYRELKAQIDDYPFLTDSDTEVLLAAFRKWGVDCLQRLNGMFAFAIWDRQERSLVVARDRMGIKPLYYFEDKGTLVFSSEIRALLASGYPPRRMNHNALADFLRYQTVHGPETMIDGVFTLPPGHYILVTESELKLEEWWSLPRAVSPVLAPRKEVLKHVRETLLSSVELRMRSDVDFGAFLSGGIDSSAVVGLMAEVSDRPIDTFNVAFKEDRFNEAQYADLIAQKFNTRHHKLVLSADDFLQQIPDALAAVDHPSGDGPNTFVVAGATKAAGVTMALSGLGGDELFAGYDIFRQATEMLDKRWMMSFPKLLRQMAGGALKQMRPGIASWKKASILNQDYLDLEHAYPYSRLIYPDKRIKELLTTSKLPPNSVHAMLKEVLDPSGPAFKMPYLSQVSLAEIKTYLQNVLLRDTDQMSMAHALEVRVPFLDHRLVTYVMGVNDPDRYPHTPKKLLTDALGNMLPARIIDRPKMGFTLPWDEWMRGSMKSFCEAALQRLGQREAFRAKGVDQLWKDYLNGHPMVTWSRVWPLVALEHWLNAHDIE